MNESANDNWQECSSQVMDELFVQHKRESRRAMLKRIGVTSAGIFSVLAGSTLLLASRKPSRDDFRQQLLMPIDCEPAIELMAKFYGNTLTDALSRRIRYHLQQCSCCRDKYLKFTGPKKVAPLCCESDCSTQD